MLRVLRRVPELRGVENRPQVDGLLRRLFRPTDYPLLATYSGGRTTVASIPGAAICAMAFLTGAT